jgi:hypothetical protein
MSPDAPDSDPALKSFLDQPSDDLAAWLVVWEGDHDLPIRTHRTGFGGKVVLALKRFARLFRPLVSWPQADRWERQRAFNQVLIGHLGQLQRSVERLVSDVDALGSDLQQVQREILLDLRQVQTDVNRNVRGLADDLDDFRRKGLVDVMRHTDALFARLDQKVDRLRRSAAGIGMSETGKKGDA